MAEKKVLTDWNLLNIILSFLGREIKNECDVCGKVLGYQILNQEIYKPYKIYVNLETCNITFLCSDECLSIYKQNFSNEKFCLRLILIYLIIGLISCFVIIFVG